jgi:hypothetical protein
MIISDMKFLMWYHSYAIYGARETLILLKPNLDNSSVSLFSQKKKNFLNNQSG